MPQRTSTDILNVLKLDIILSNYCILDESWQRNNFIDPHSRLYFIRKGNGWIRYNGKTVKLEAGHVYLIPSHLELSYGCTHLEKIFFHIIVRGFEKTDILSAFKDIYSLPFSEEDFCKLLSLTDSDDYIGIMKLKQFLYATVINFFDNYFPDNLIIKNYSETVKKIIIYIQNNLSMSLTTEEIAKNLFLSKTTVATAFKKETGTTIGEYIDNLIFTKISYLLANDSISIREISQQFGFCDSHYLSRRFKKKFKVTPTEFRKMHSK